MNLFLAITVRLRDVFYLLFYGAMLKMLRVATSLLKQARKMIFYLGSVCECLVLTKNSCKNFWHVLLSFWFKGLAKKIFGLKVL